MTDAWCDRHHGGMTFSRILERILIGLAIGVGRNQINGAINRRRAQRGSYRRPGLPRRNPSIGPLFWSTFVIATTLLLIFNH